MTAEEYLEKDYFHLAIDSRESNISVGEIEGVMKEYAKLKCQELLETVAEKASKLPATIYIKPNTPHYARLGKDSILNVVDLNEFIS